MKPFVSPLKIPMAVALISIAFLGCESTGGGGNVSGSVYYGVGFHDPWYYGGYHDDVDIIVRPPLDRPGGGARPEHPLPPPSSAAPRPTPMPSIPSTPRAMPRGGGGRR